MTREFHEVANIFPLMQGDEFEALKADIASNGQREPIWLHTDGSIIDGRNRYRACMDLDIQPVFRTWDGKGSLVAFVVSLNLHRRHLDAGQRSMIGLTVKDMLAKEIAETISEKRRAAVNTRWGNDEEPQIQMISTDHLYLEEVEEAPRRDALQEAATVVGVSKTYMIQAQAVQKHAPEMAQRVASGEMKLNAAYREVQHQQKRQAPPLPTSKYRVVYADPPWSYGNSGIIGDTDNYGRAERHYPTMSIDELCAMGTQVREMADDNAVLFMWVTSPLLEECFPVIKAWGFKYKTSFVWDKVRHNYGHYNSVRHELLLICTRGSCTPDVPKLFDSVVEYERTDNHSEKPEHFREMIDTLYPHGNRIELFARRAVDGWDGWGNE
jgi:N6-adenosine-specific RNA methylase IME4